MKKALSAVELLDRCFLEIRSRTLDVAAALDRIDRGVHPQEIAGDRRIAQLKEALAVLADGRPDRAQRVQLVFSLEYERGWRVSPQSPVT